MGCVWKKRPGWKGRRENQRSGHDQGRASWIAVTTAANEGIKRGGGRGLGFVKDRLFLVKTGTPVLSIGKCPLAIPLFDVNNAKQSGASWRTGERESIFKSNTLRFHDSYVFLMRCVAGCLLLHTSNKPLLHHRFEGKCKSALAAPFLCRFNSSAAFVTP